MTTPHPTPQDICIHGKQVGKTCVKCGGICIALSQNEFKEEDPKVSDAWARKQLSPDINPPMKSKDI